MSERTPTRAEVIRMALDNRLMDLFVAMPCKVQSFDAANQRADIVPQTQRVLRDGDGNRVTEELPVLPAVPVLFPAGNGFFLKFALSKGDTVLAVVCDRDVGNWVTTGSSDPVDDRVHSLGGAVCFPVDFKQAGPGPFQHLAMGSENGKQVHVKQSEITLGTENPTDAVVLANKLVQMFNAHIHECATPGAPSKTPTTPLTAAQIQSNVVKSE